MQKQLLNDLISWVKNASSDALKKKRDRLDVVLRYALTGSCSDVKEAISVIDGEMDDRMYQQRQASLAS